MKHFILNVEIGPYTWSVYFVDDLAVEGTPCDGATVSDTQEILLRSDLRGEALEVAWRHEVGHAALDAYGVQLEDDVEEAVVDAIAKGFVQVLKTPLFH